MTFNRPPTRRGRCRRCEHGSTCAAAAQYAGLRPQSPDGHRSDGLPVPAPGRPSACCSGPDGWDSFVRLARSPLFLTLDVVLLFGVVYHMFNGIRVALVGMGVATGNRKGCSTGWWVWRWCCSSSARY